MVEQGWLGVAVDEAEGGLGLGAVELGGAARGGRPPRRAGAVPVDGRGARGCPAARAPTELVADLVGGTLAHVSRGARTRRCRAAATAPPSRVARIRSPFASIADLALVRRARARRRTRGVRVYLSSRRGRPPVAEPAMDLTRPLGLARARRDRRRRRLGGAELADSPLDLGATASALRAARRRVGRDVDSPSSTRRTGCSSGVRSARSRR